MQKRNSANAQLPIGEIYRARSVETSKIWGWSLPCRLLAMQKIQFLLYLDLDVPAGWTSLLPPSEFTPQQAGTSLKVAETPLPFVQIDLHWFIVDCWHTKAIPLCQGVFMSIQVILISLHTYVKRMALEVKPYTCHLINMRLLHENCPCAIHCSYRIWCDVVSVKWLKPITRCDQLIGKALWQSGWILYDTA